MPTLTTETELATMVDFTVTDNQKALRDLAHDFGETRSLWGRVVTYPGG
jgi:hypothetical protein